MAGRIEELIQAVIDFTGGPGNERVRVDAVLEVGDLEIGAVEIKDHSGVYQEWNFPALGQGVVDISGVLNLLREHDYQGPITMEIEGVEGIDWDEETTKRAIEDSVDYLHSVENFQ